MVEMKKKEDLEEVKVYELVESIAWAIVGVSVEIELWKWSEEEIWDGTFVDDFSCVRGIHPAFEYLLLSYGEDHPKPHAQPSKKPEMSFFFFS